MTIEMHYETEIAAGLYSKEGMETLQPGQIVMSDLSSSPRVDKNGMNDTEPGIPVEVVDEQTIIYYSKPPRTLTGQQINEDPYFSETTFYKFLFLGAKRWEIKYQE